MIGIIHEGHEEHEEYKDYIMLALINKFEFLQREKSENQTTTEIQASRNEHIFKHQNKLEKYNEFNIFLMFLLFFVSIVSLVDKSYGTTPFGVGEVLRYHLDFSFLRAGYSEMAILAVDSIYGEPSYYFRSRVKSTSTVDVIYKVRDTVESWFAVDSLYSMRYQRWIHEGGYHSIKFFDYNHRTGWVSISNENGPKGVTPFIPYSHNIISALYWVRCQPLQAGKELHLNLHDQTVQYPLTVRVYGLEKVEVPAGTFTCWKIEPVIESEGLFKAAGRLWVWLTDDERRLPVMMRSEIVVGSIVGRLVEYHLGKPYSPGIKPVYVDKDDWDW